MPATTPSGWNSDQLSIAGPTSLLCSPFSSSGAPQAYSTTSIPRASWPRASSSTLPCSSVISAAMRSALRSSSSLKRNITRARFVSGVVPRQPGKAAPAAATAAATSSREAAATCRTTWPIAGLATGSSLPVAATGRPWIVPDGGKAGFQRRGCGWVHGAYQGRETGEVTMIPAPRRPGRGFQQRPISPKPPTRHREAGGVAIVWRCRMTARPARLHDRPRQHLSRLPPAGGRLRLPQGGRTAGARRDGEGLPRGRGPEGQGHVGGDRPAAGRGGTRGTGWRSQASVRLRAAPCGTAGSRSRATTATCWWRNSPGAGPGYTVKRAGG